MSKSANRRVIIVSLLLLALASTFNASAEVVSDAWRNSIEPYLRQVDSTTTAEIVIYVVQSLRGHGIKDDGTEITNIVSLGVYVFNELPLETPNGTVVGIGKRGKDNGVLLLVAIEEHEWRIEVGYGLEGYITDIESNLIAQQYLVPKFQEGEYGQGLYDTAVALSQKIPVPSETDLQIRGKYLYENTNPPAAVEIPPWVTAIIIAIFAIVIAVMVAIAYLAKKGKIKMRRVGSARGGYAGGGSGGQGRKPSSGPKGGGGRSGGGGSGGKW